MIKRRRPPEEIRAFDCIRYPECLAWAAKQDEQKMRCVFCSMKDDQAGMIGVDNLKAADVVGCRELLQEIFFGKGLNIETVDAAD